MSRMIFRNGEKVESVIVGVNQSGKYHKKECRFYSSTEIDMRESKAVAAGHICGECCKNL